METDIKETVNKLREVEKKCIKSRYETYGRCQCQGCRYALEQHNCLAKLEEWAKDTEKAKIISEEIGIDEIVRDRNEEISNNVPKYLERMYDFETSVNHSPMFYRNPQDIAWMNEIGEISFNRPMNDPLYQGLREKNLGLVKKACAENRDLNKLDKYGKTPIMYACLIGSLEIVQELVKHGADVNKRDLLNWTPAFYAKDVAIVDYLLSVGADINAQDYRGNNLILNSLLAAPGSHAYGSAQQFSLIKLLVDHGINVNAKDNKGYTALMYLVSSHISDKKKLIKLLRTNPTTDVNIKNGEGKTAIDIVKKSIDNTIEYARLRQAIEEQRGTIGGCVVEDESEDYVPPREKVKLPEIDEVELTSLDKEDIEECNKIIDILKKREGK